MILLCQKYESLMGLPLMLNITAEGKPFFYAHTRMRNIVAWRRHAGGADDREERIFPLDYESV